MQQERQRQHGQLRDRTEEIVVEFPRFMTALSERVVWEAMNRTAWDSERSEFIPTSWTAEALAAYGSIEPKDAQAALDTLRRRHYITRREHRSGVWLYKRVSVADQFNGVGLRGVFTSLGEPLPARAQVGL